MGQPRQRREPPQRTGATPLSNDELLILDFLFDKRAQLKHLDSASYQVHMNCGYTHQLSDADLRHTIQKLLEMGFVASRDVRGQQGVLRLTRAGGAAWESERKPAWERYVSHHASTDVRRNRTTTFHVESPSLETLHAFVAAARAAGLFHPSDASGFEGRSYWLRLMQRWFSFTHRFALSFKADYGRSRDYHALKSGRWWTHVCDLDCLT